MTAIFYYWIRDFYLQKTKEELLKDIELIYLIAKENRDFNALALKIKKDLNLRITFILEDGDILAESDKDKKYMDNHKNRPEVVIARLEGFGYSVRHSNTLNKELLYVVKRYKMGDETIYIRLAKPLNEINESLFYLVLRVVGVIVLFAVMLFLIFYKIGLDIEREIQTILRFLKSLIKKRRVFEIDSNFSKEFSQIAKLLSKISRILTKQENYREKYLSKLEASNREKENIISAISHEFKNPIAVIEGYSQTLLEDEIDERIRERFLKKISKNAKKLVKMIDTLRLAVKLEDKKQSINFKEFDIYESVKEVIEDLKESFKDREIILKGESLFIKGDKILMEIVIKNLIENALKYSEDEVFVFVDKEGISVKDKGIGIKEEEIKNITNKFYRSDKNVWSNSLGLGLFIVSNIIKLHGFRLEIQSILNKGSIFSVKFTS